MAANKLGRRRRVERRSRALPQGAARHRDGGGSHELAAAVISEAVEGLEITDAERRLPKYETPVEVSGDGAGERLGLRPVDGFGALGRADGVLREVARCRYWSPKPVRWYAMQDAMAGRDFMACALTGSGNAAAFCLVARAARSGGPQYVPTRDATQISIQGQATRARRIAVFFYDEDPKLCLFKNLHFIEPQIIPWDAVYAIDTLHPVTEHIKPYHAKQHLLNFGMRPFARCFFDLHAIELLPIQWSKLNQLGLLSRSGVAINLDIVGDGYERSIEIPTLAWSVKRAVEEQTSLPSEYPIKKNWSSSGTVDCKGHGSVRTSANKTYNCYLSAKEPTGSCDYPTKLNNNMRRHSSSRQFGLSGARVWLFSLVMMLLLVKAESVSTNSSMFCPAVQKQFKRGVRTSGHWITRTSPNLLEEETECKVTELQPGDCRKLSVKQVTSATGAFLSVISNLRTFVDKHGTSAAGALLSIISNLGTLKPIIGIRNINPNQRKLLSFSSLFVAISNLCWTVQLGAKDGLNWLSYIALLFGFFFHGYSCCFFWQNCVSMVCISSVITFFVSIVATVVAGFIARAPFMRIGPESILGTGIPAAVAGILGVISTGFGIYFRIQSNKDNDGYHRVLFITVPCGALSTFLSMYAYGFSFWESEQLCFKLGLAILFAARLIESLQLLFWCCWRAPAQPPEDNDLNVGLLQFRHIDMNESASGTTAAGEETFSDGGLGHGHMDTATTGGVSSEGSAGYATNNHVNGQITRQTLPDNDNEPIANEDSNLQVMAMEENVVRSDSESESERGNVSNDPVMASEENVVQSDSESESKQGNGGNLQRWLLKRMWCILTVNLHLSREMAAMIQ